jgi:hypothetical protein
MKIASLTAKTQPPQHNETRCQRYEFQGVAEAKRSKQNLGAGAVTATAPRRTAQDAVGLRRVIPIFAPIGFDTWFIIS